MKVEGASAVTVIAEATVAVSEVAAQSVSVEPIVAISEVAAQPVSVQPACTLTTAESNNVAAAATPPVEWADPAMSSAGAPVSEAKRETPPFVDHEEGSGGTWVREQKQGTPVTPPLVSDHEDDSWGMWGREQKRGAPATPPLVSEHDIESWSARAQEQKQRAPVTPPKKESWQGNSWWNVGENNQWDQWQEGQEQWSSERGTRWQQGNHSQEASWPNSSWQDLAHQQCKAQRHEDSWKKSWGQQGQASTAWKRHEKGYDSRHETNEAWSKRNEWWKDRNYGSKTRPARSEHRSWKAKDQDSESTRSTTALVPWRDAETQARLDAVESERQLAEAEKSFVQKKLAETQARLEALESQKQIAETEKEIAQRQLAQIASAACLPPLCAEAMPPNQAPFPIFGRDGWQLATGYPDRGPNGGHAIADHDCVSGGRESQAPALPISQLGFGACPLQQTQLASVPQQLLPDGLAHGPVLHGQTQPDVKHDQQQVPSASGFASCSSQSQPQVELLPEQMLPSRPSTLLHSRAQQHANFAAEAEIDGVLPQEHSLAGGERRPGPTQRPKKPLPGPGGVLSRVSQR